MTMKTERTHEAQAGFALILAILALLLLTFLGLTLATTTSSELQIATNYRWSQQAFYNAEAGIEAGKLILRGIPNGWTSVLPTRRNGTAGWPAANPAPKCTAATCGTFPGTRNYEGSDCDDRNGIGYGAVLQNNQDVTQWAGRNLNGAFTLWIKRDVVPSGANLVDELPDPPAGADTYAILTSEGVAPQANTVAGGTLAQARAVRVLQVKLSYGAVTRGCQAAEGQTGTTAGGANFGACAPLDTGSLDQALGGGGGNRADLGVK
jgi:Tfp pilus assembly protein PilX